MGQYQRLRNTRQLASNSTFPPSQRQNRAADSEVAQRRRQHVTHSLSTSLNCREQTIAGEVSGATTVGSFADEWFTRWRESSKPPASTVRTYRAAVRWIRDELGMLRLTECTTGRLEKGIGRISDAHGQATAKQARSVLRRIFADAVRLDALTANPALGISTVKERPQEVRAMTAEEVQALRTAARRRGKRHPSPRTSPSAARSPTASTSCSAPGVRTGELLGIRWHDVDLDADLPTVSVMGTVTRRRRR